MVTDTTKDNVFRSEKGVMFASLEEDKFKVVVETLQTPSGIKYTGQALPLDDAYGMYRFLHNHFENKKQEAFIESLKGTTKICPECGCTEMIPLSSIDTKMCSGCGHEMDWPLEEGQVKVL